MLSLVAFAAVTFAAAATGGLFPPDAWYARLRKPAWNPPNWVFAPVWTLLYVGIAAAGWLAWRAAGDAWSPALTLWALQLAANAAWSWLFFGRHHIAAALVDVALLVALVLAFILVTYDQVRVAAWLFVPYLAWTSFATVLNARILALNGPRGG